MGLDYVVVGVISAGMLVYLLYCLLMPERL
jgi:K+-transporting ATPase KdpF subunit